ncbi:SET domain-containing protein 9 isoform X4 [Aquila chrysaetos chrysaetos]|uniref:SET domain-containing protein 9 isoform X4 n=1 Tax=Aquila chrysaetos chrysaetos TaxID=223781 RepID=UPI0005D0A1C9|nr:SET domain-containing protein 9 isoform X4 [Aquila chrysaetos chrysaetos]
MLRALRRRWDAYKYRFVPWLALNLRRKRRTLRYVPESSQDKIISDEDVFETLLKVFKALFINDFSRHAHILALLPEIKCTVYRKHEPIFFQSLGNPFIFRCIDGVLIDGNDKGLSRSVYRFFHWSLKDTTHYVGGLNALFKVSSRCWSACTPPNSSVVLSPRSCSRRDQLGPFQMSDESWLTAALQNPLAVGQYVNNCSHEKAANVCYQEFDVPGYFPVELKQYLPNIVYSHDIESHLRCVVLVALRDIKQGEELFSNYYTVVG